MAPSSSSSRGRSSSPFQHRKPSASSSASSASFYNSGNAFGSRSVTPSHSRSESAYSKGYGSLTPVEFPVNDELVMEPVDTARSGGESISVTIRFRPLSEREYQKGDEIAWYPDGDKLVRNEYNPLTSYAFDRVFGPSAATQDVYEVAPRPVVKNAMEGINGMESNPGSKID